MKTMRFLQFSVIVVLVLMTLSPISVSAQSPQVLYAVQGGQTSGACDSWATACDLQYALTSAVSGQEIWVAAGVYKPTTDSIDRTATFQLKNGVGLYGGFVGSETTRDQRNWETNKTILSGDIDNNDINDDGNFIAETTTEIQGENAYHVVTGSNTDNTAVLDGFIINAGQANDGENFPNYHGGGMYSENGNPTLMNITFSANLATFGGGISNYYGSPTLSNVIFSGNSAASYGGNGGGISNIDGNPTLTNIIFFNNSADSYGGGIYGGGNLTLTNATFYENSARSGGGVYNSSGSLILKNIQFLKNSAISWGGGMYVSTSNLALTGGIFLENYADQGGGLMNHYSSTTQLTNVTFSTNSAADGGGIFNDTYSNLTVINSILWGDSAPNGSELKNGYESVATVTYSDVQGGWPGDGNIDADPLFVEPANGDLHLQAGSPAIDRGTNDGCPTADFDGIVRPQDGNGDGVYTCDMGAYEAIGIPGTPPANDNFADAAIIDTLPFGDAVNNMFATVETDEPQYCDTSPRTVWYKFTPAANAEVVINTEGSSFGDTVLSVYEQTGSGFGGLSHLNCISWGGSFTFSAQAGVTYYIQAGSIASFGGELHVNLQEVFPPPNDNFANAAIIGTLPTTLTANNLFATLETDEPQYCETASQTVWYKFTPAEDMWVYMDMAGSSFGDTTAKVYQATGPTFGDLSFIKCLSFNASASFHAQVGTTYYIQAGSIYSSGGEIHLNLNFPPPNDSFSAATTISTLPFIDTVDTTWATVEPDESQHCDYSPRTVWYTFTPTANIEVRVTSEGSLFSDIVLTAYRDTGGGLGGLEAFTCVSWGGSLTFAVEQGATYYIQAGYIYNSGELQVNLQEVPPPANDNFADATLISPPLPFDETVDTAGATAEAGEPLSSCAGYGGPYKSIWYAYTPGTSGVISANVPSAVFAPVLAVYTGNAMDALTELGCQVFSGNPVNVPVEAGTTYYFQVSKYTTWDPDGSVQFQLRELNPPANDNFNDATAIGTLPFSNIVDVTDATTEHGEPQYCYYSSRTVWYSFTPAENMLVQADMSGSSFGDTNFNIYQSIGPGFGGLNFMQCASYGSSATVRLQAGVTYYFQAGSISGSGGNLQFNLQQLPLPPNDDFANAKAITVLPFSDTVDITNATIEPGEPQNCYYMSKTLWYSFTPTENALVRADMNGSGFWDTNFNIYRAVGPGFGDLNFQQCASFGSSVTFTVEAGTTYYIQTGSVYGGSGNLQLNLVELPRPANDDFAKATLVSLPLPFDDTVDTQYASWQSGEPTPSCASYGPGSRSVWYAFTPETSGSVSARIPSAAFTPVIAAYTGNSLNNLSQIGCQTSSNLLTFHANAGTTYYFQIGNYYSWESGGFMQFHLDVAPQPVAGFYYSPSDPSVFDTIQFYDASYDPGQAGIQSYAWDFGDGTTSTFSYPTHKYAKDGDYTVQLSITTVDGRTASTTQIVSVRTHDVAITKLAAPNAASAGQTRSIVVSISSKQYAETVRVDLYKSVPGGFEFIGSVTLDVPASATKRSVAFNFSYTFTSSDANIGKVTFKAIATIVNARDSYPSDNEAISSPPTRVSRPR